MWEKKPLLFLILATMTILVGTIVTMVLPFFWVNTEADRIETVTPYSPLEQAGRDIYIREGCNNCHTQTVRPLVAEVLRYGEYSKSGEYIYDRPHLWGSRRTGPDLARVGGKYPDAWHYQHMAEPASMFPRTNMPAYPFLSDRTLNPRSVERNMRALGLPYTDAEIAALEGKTEMDAMVAYMQKLGTGIPWREAARTTFVGELTNPYSGDASVLPEARQIYAQNCAACHGAELQGGIGPALRGGGKSESQLYEITYNGIMEKGMPGYSHLGSDRVWKLITLMKAE
ncbi:cytochrome c oxidase, cbb3-type, subunit II [Desulfurispirillum indicum S5]|uniref:Cytochrome c oxidase, cbb3-type, subunit II n=1 Tax=Desulfurispirillum indicum (strain ATCC BAA-1389 / DSM 22839 / S5) TaxID=653733 RepID=E6W3A8_DESIS|nr:cytochrome-c oxidase, cbb3-type subunit II [Desulfurispirillum indicum]ADU66862.1 cytochrome c oxidase, cbb3-type, subunit II [Desulfurispirillum indicum S5]